MNVTKIVTENETHKVLFNMVYPDVTNQFNEDQIKDTKLGDMHIYLILV